LTIHDSLVFQVIRVPLAPKALLVQEASVVLLAPKALPVHTAQPVLRANPARTVWTAGAMAPLVVTANPERLERTDTTGAMDVMEPMALVDTKETKATLVTKDCPAFRASGAPREIRATLVVEDLVDHPVCRARAANRVVTASTVSR
jgi:hypothetical protein